VAGSLLREPTCMCGVTPETLWAGPDPKSVYAFFHFSKMQRALEPERDGNYAAQEAMGTIVDSGWQRSFGPYFDAFLSAARSIPDIIECCFGTDKQMSWWIKTLPPDEQDRRNRFSKEFADTRQAFALLPLSNARRTSVHRRGYAPYEFKIAGRFGLAYAGSPTKSVPLSETPVITDPTFPPDIARASPIGPPHYTDFEIDGQPIFLSCHEYLNQAQALIAEGRKIAAAVHGANTLTPPPDA
jgi:hypothetical protein